MKSIRAAATCLAFFLLTVSGLYGQGAAAGLSIVRYQLISEKRILLDTSEFTYSVVLQNTGAARSEITGTVRSTVPNAVVQGIGNVHFAPVPANGTTTSLDTFTIIVDRSVSFDLSSLQWSFTAPFANAGPNQTVSVGSNVILDGSKSTNPSGFGILTYTWTFLSRPPGTSARILNSNSVRANLIPDVTGTYIVQLTVDNGAGIDTAIAFISTDNTAPVANAGPNQTVPLGSTVFLNGAASSDVNGDPLTYSWIILSKPAGSAAQLSSSNIVNPTFTADKPGSYQLQLIVNDGKVNSQPSTVTITTQNSPPVANAGSNQSVAVGATVQLNGAGSTDVDGDTLTYQWSLITVPSGSTAALSSATVVSPTFKTDKPGTYVAQLIVNDGTASSSPATVTITTSGIQAPTANAGQNQSAKRFALVTLNGSGNDPQSLPLTFQWSLTTKPANSNATLSNATSQNPTFVPDQLGSYVAQLIVNNGYVNSAPATVTVTTSNTAPVANAGLAQTVQLASVVTLNGTASSDADQDALTYSWSFLSRPPNSAATISAATSATPTFLADQPGTFVVQLIVNDGTVNSTPATVTITVTGNNIVLTPDPLNLFGSAGTLTLSIPSAAPVGGQVINLAALDPSIANVPPTVTIPEGAKTIDITVTPLSQGSTIVSASSAGLRTTTATVIVNIPKITVTIASSTIGLSKTTTGTVTLSAPAPAGGTQVTLSTNPNGVVTVNPNSVTIAAGATTADFTVTGSNEGTAIITGSSAGYISGFVNIAVGKLGQILLAQALTVGPGQSVPVQVSLASAAPAGGVTISLQSSNTGVATVTPDTVVIPQGNTVPASQPMVNGVALGSATITASAAGFTGDSKSVIVSAALSFAPSSLTIGIGATQNLTLNLSGVAPQGGLLINLVSSTPAATVPASVTIPAGQSSVQVPVNGVSEGQSTVTANSSVQGVTSASATVNVSSLGGIQLPSNVSVALGQSVPFPISLSSAAPAGGVTITLSSADSNKATIAPASVTISGGSTTPAVQPQVTGTGPGSVNINASSSGFGSSVRQIQVTASFGFAPSTLTLNSSETKNITLNLSGPAPSGGLQVTLQSDNTNAATVSGSTTIPAGATSVQVAVTGVSAGTANIRATAVNVTEAVAAITVTGSGAISIGGSQTAPIGGSATLTITLPTPAPNNLTVSLNSSDTSKVTISPQAVQIQAGQTQPGLQPTVTGVNFGSATITASAPNYISGTRIITVPGSLSFDPPTLTATSSTLVQLALSTQAPDGGLQVTLNSSNPSVASVASVINIPAGGSVVRLQITIGSNGTSTITASAPGLTSGTLFVTVGTVTSSSVLVPNPISVGVGQSAPFPISISAPAPAGGVTVNLTSGDPSKVTISPASVTIQSGQTQPASQPQVTGVAPGSAVITAAAQNFTAGTQNVTVTGSITLSPNLTFNALETKNMTVTIPSAAPSGGVIVTLSSNNTSAATVPQSVIIAQNTTSQTVPVTSTGPGQAVITASANSFGQATANVNVQTGADIILPSNFVVAPGDTVTFPVQLATAAASTTFITLESADPSKLSFSTSTLIVNAGQTQPTAQPKVNGLGVGSFTVTASASGLTTASTKVRVGFAMQFSPAKLNITGTATQNLTLTLSAPAPEGGLSVSLNSSNTSAATVPPSLNFQAGVSVLSVPVKGVAPGQTTITASSNGLDDTTADVTVVAAASIILPSNPAVKLDQTAPFPISISSPAGFGGVTVSLSSADTNKLTITPQQVVIPEGQTQPVSQPVMAGVNVGDIAITASAPGYTGASTTVKISSAVIWVDPVTTLAQGESKVVFLKLDASAPWPPYGVTVNLVAADPSVVQVQQSVDFYPDGSQFTTAAIVVTGLKAGSTTITATGINIPPAVLTVNVTGPVAVATTSLPNGSVNVAYNFTLKAAGGKAPYTWALTGGTLPANLNLDSATGVISGTPVAAANNIPLTFRVTDSSSPNQNASANLTLSITQSQPASISATSGTPQSAVIGTAFPSALAVTVRDAGNNPMQGVMVTFTAPANGASGTFANGNNTALTNASGVATSQAFTANNTSGSYNVIASVAGLQPTASFALTNTPPGSIVVPANLTLNVGQVSSFNVTLPGPAPAGGVQVNLFSNDNSKVTITPGIVTVPEGQTQPPIQPQVTGIAPGSAIITASANNYTSGTSNVQVNGGIGLSPQTLSVIAGQSQNLTATLPSVAPQGGLTLTVSAQPAGIATVPATVQVPAGSNSITIPVTGVSQGSTVVSVSNASIGSATANVNVVGVLAITTNSLPNGKVGAPYSKNLNATGGTPQYTWALINGTFPQGLNLNQSTGQIFGTATATATATPLTFRVTDSGSPAQQATVTLNLTIALPIATSATVTGGDLQSTRTNTAFASPLSVQVRDQDGDPMGNVTVTFTPQIGSNGATATFNNGNTAVTNEQGIAVSNTVVANSRAGAFSVNATAAGGPATTFFTLANTGGAPTSISPTQGSPQLAVVGTVFAIPLVATVRDVDGNPVGNRFVTFTIVPGNSSSTPPTGTFPGQAITFDTTTDGAGRATLGVPLTAGETLGTFTVEARTPGVAEAAIFNLTIALVAPPPPTLTLTGTTVGKNLQSTLILNVSANSDVTLTSSDPSKLLISDRPITVGSGSLVIPGVTGGSATQVTVQALSDSGTVTVTAQALGLTATANVVLSPTGIFITGPNGAGGNFSTFTGASTNLTISVGRLGPSGNFAEAQPVRAGAPVTVQLTQAPTLGTLPAQVTIGATATDTTATFTPSSSGAATLSVFSAGFATPTSGGSLTATVSSAKLIAPAMSVGNNLQRAFRILLDSPNPANLAITITSNDPSKLRFAQNPGDSGAASITVTLTQAGRLSTPDLYAQGWSDSGTATYSVTANGYSSSQGTVSLAKSGIAFTGIVSDPVSPLVVGGPTTTLTVTSVIVSASGAFIEELPLRGGLNPVSVSIRSSAAGVASINSSPVTLSPTVTAATTDLIPVSPGTSSITIDPVSGFTPVVDRSTLNFRVIQPNMRLLSPTMTVGNKLQSFGLIFLGAPAPSGGLNITLTSNDPARLLLSASGTQAGSPSITVNVPAGQATANYFVQGNASSGSVVYTVQASGFPTVTGSVDLTPSGIVIEPDRLASFYLITLAKGSGPQPVKISVARLNPGTLDFAETQALAGGLTLSVPVDTSDSSLGSMSSPVQIVGGSDSGFGTFTINPPSTRTGQTVLSVGQQPGFDLPVNGTAIQLRVQ